MGLGSSLVVPSWPRSPRWCGFSGLAAVSFENAGGFRLADLLRTHTACAKYEAALSFTSPLVAGCLQASNTVLYNLCVRPLCAVYSVSAAYMPDYENCL